MTAVTEERPSATTA
ncbi:hypothetical protein CGLO_14677 [Colletotrichum gloeosporioides Cg-14]|uniref:Uncharacterized protein n=1 Tax=Colletotrichum gloeosporioides (strain Cg-14) TaxID=1237896 RepID=T0K3F0_COLGC|nr:hypothetical protein CGLO_14677 [Colletotrichum gloeosporioides Cg-14]